MAKKKRKLTKKQLDALAKGRAMKYGRKLPKVKKSRSTVQTMAKRRKATKRRTYSSKKKSMFSGIAGALGAVAYGAVRETLSDKIANSRLGRQLPATQFTDEAVMLALNFGARKVGLGKNPIGNSILKAQKTVELARVGQGIKDVMTQRQSATSNTKNNGLVILS